MKSSSSNLSLRSAANASFLVFAHDYSDYRVEVTGVSTQ